MITEQPRAAIYARVSTQAQAKNGYSLLEQLRLLPELARNKGFLVEEGDIFSEVESGANDDRPAYNRMMAQVMEGKYSAIYVIERSRLSRTCSRIEEEKIVTALKKHGCLVFTPQTTMEIQSVEGELLWDILAALDRNERKRLMTRLGRGRETKWREGHYVGGYLPYGYGTKIDPQTGKRMFYIDEPKMRQVQTAFSLLTEGLNINLIYKQFKYKGYVNGAGKPIEAEDIHSWARNYNYAGYTCRGYSLKSKSKDKFLLPHNLFLEPVISRIEFDYLQMDIKRKVPILSFRHHYPLSHIMVCPVCQSPVQLYQTEGRRSYSCSKRVRNIRKCRGQSQCFSMVIAHSQAIQIVECLVLFVQRSWPQYEKEKNDYELWLIRSRLKAYTKKYQRSARLTQKKLKFGQRIRRFQQFILEKIFYIFFDTVHYESCNTKAPDINYQIVRFKTRWGEEFDVIHQKETIKIARRL